MMFKISLRKLKILNIVVYCVRLRTGTSCLFTGKGRYENLPREEKSCPLCKSGIEDINYFLFKCDKLKESRRVFLDKFYKLTGDSFKDRPFLFQARKILNLNLKRKGLLILSPRGSLNFINYDRN